MSTEVEQGVGVDYHFQPMSQQCLIQEGFSYDVQVRTEELHKPEAQTAPVADT